MTWNFEKFLVAADGAVVARFRPKVLPEDPRLVAAIKAISILRGVSRAERARLVIGLGGRDDCEAREAGDVVVTRPSSRSRIRPVTGGRSASVTMPGCAATTYGTALVTGIAV